MSERKYQINQDEHYRFGAQVTPDIHVAVRVLSETDPLRSSRGVYGHAVITLQTSVGPFRIRYIHIAKNLKPTDSLRGDSEFKVRWLSRETGQKMEDGRQERLDVAGPLDPQTRRAFANHILGVFNQVREMALKGELFRKDEEFSD